MLKKKFNRVSFSLSIKAVGPLLINFVDRDKDKDKDKDKKNNKLQFLRTNQGNGDPYIPGSSLKGVFRSVCEKIMWILSDVDPMFCNPVASSGDFKSCSQKLKEKENNQKNIKAYKDSCPVCKLFGNQYTRGRIYISDAYLDNDINQKLKTRDGAPINRFVGSNNNLFKYEYIVDKTFNTDIIIENFELWQLGLLAYLFRDLYSEMIKIGFGSSRGMGKVKGEINTIEFEYFNPSIELIKDDKLMVYGIGSLDNDKKYNYVSDKSCSIKLDVLNQANFSPFPYYKLENKGKYQEGLIWQFLSEIANCFNMEEINHGKNCS